LKNIESVPDNVLEYLLQAILTGLTIDNYTYNLDQLQQLVDIAREHCSDKNLANGAQMVLQMKHEGIPVSIGMNIDEFRQSIIEMYNANPSSVTRILEKAREISVSLKMGTTKL
jgi:hypothetical protein